MLRKDERIWTSCILFILILLIILIFLTVIPVSTAGSDFLINEDFSNDRNWTPNSGTWKAINGEYKLSNSAYPSLSFAGDNNWDDYTSEAKVKFNSMGGIGLVFRANNEKEYYVAYLYLARGKESISLYKHAGPGITDRTIIVLYNTPLVLNKWYTLKVRVKGDSIKIYLDNILKIEQEDATYTDGKIGLYSWGTDASFDDVKVYPGDFAPTATQTVVATSPLPLPLLQAKDIVKELPVSAYDYKISSDYSLGNNNWNGASKIYELTKEKGYITKSLESFRIAYNWKNSVMVILYPDFGIDPVELYNYVVKGGNVLIADDFGYGNYVLSKFPVSFGNGEVGNEKNNYAGKNYAPIVSSFKEQTIAKADTNMVTNVVTNHPTYLIPGNKQATAHFPQASYVEKNFNGLRDPDEIDAPDESLVFANAFEVGKGRIIVISDPSIFTNGMFELGDNKAFYENTLTWLSRGSTYYTVFFEKRLERIPNRKLLRAQKQLNETESRLNEGEKECNENDYKQCLDSIAKGEYGIENARDTLYGKEGKERAKSEIEKTLKEFENLKQEINASKQSENKTAQAQQYLRSAEEKIKNALKGYSSGDYPNAIKDTREADNALSKARDVLFDKNSKERAILELSGAQKDLKRLNEELYGLKINNPDIKERKNIISFLNPLFTLQTWFLLFMALAAMFLGEQYLPTVSSFFKRSGTTSGYLHSMEKATTSDNFNEPAIIMGQEFKEIFYKKIGITPEMPIKEVVKLAHSKYPDIKKRRLRKTLNTIQKREPEENKIYAARFSGKEMEKLYSDIYAILNEIKEVESFENRRYRQ